MRKRDVPPRPEDLDCLVDLHLHLDGALSPASVRELAAMQRIPVPAKEDELLRLLRVDENCHDLNDFLTKFAFPCSLLQTADGLRTAVRNLLCECRAQGVAYAEVRFAPQLSTEKGLTQSDAVEAALAGIAESGVPAQLILCCMRGADAAANRETVRTARTYLGRGVCALDLAGAEALFPNADYAELFAEAKAAGVPFTLHAGEAAGPDSVYTALDMGACRIGHGVRSCEDPALLLRLADRKVPLELCPTSNLCTEVFPDLSAYPLRLLMAAGVTVTVNTDDPSIEGTTLRTEYRKLIDTFALTKPEVRRLLNDAIRASFAPDKLKKELLGRVRQALK